MSQPNVDNPVRGLVYAALASLPIWVLVIWVVFVR